MSGLFGKKQDFVIMSPFKAKITHKGEPVKNAKVKLWYSWNTKDEAQSDRIKKDFETDGQGVLEMPEITQEIFVSNVQPTVSKYVISIEIEEELIDFFSATKKGSGADGELSSPIDNLVCELSQNNILVYDEETGGKINTRCRAEAFNKFKVFDL